MIFHFSTREHSTQIRCFSTWNRKKKSVLQWAFSRSSNLKPFLVLCFCWCFFRRSSYISPRVLLYDDTSSVFHTRNIRKRTNNKRHKLQWVLDAFLVIFTRMTMTFIYLRARDGLKTLHVFVLRFFSQRNFLSYFFPITHFSLALKSLPMRRTHQKKGEILYFPKMCSWRKIDTKITFAVYC